MSYKWVVTRVWGPDGGPRFAKFCIGDRLVDWIEKQMGLVKFLADTDGDFYCIEYFYCLPVFCDDMPEDLEESVDSDSGWDIMLEDPAPDAHELYTDYSIIKISSEYFSFRAMIKGNPHEYETQQIDWNELRSEL